MWLRQVAKCTPDNDSQPASILQTADDRRLNVIQERGVCNHLFVQRNMASPYNNFFTLSGASYECNVCNDMVGKGTSDNMKDHLRNKHPELFSRIAVMNRVVQRSVRGIADSSGEDVNAAPLYAAPVEAAPLDTVSVYAALLNVAHSPEDGGDNADDVGSLEDSDEDDIDEQSLEHILDVLSDEENSDSERELSPAPSVEIIEQVTPQGTPHQLAPAPSPVPGPSRLILPGGDWKFSGKSTVVMDKKVMNMLSSAILPPSFLNDPGFKDLLKTLEPKYHPISHKFQGLSYDELDLTYKACLRAVKADLKSTVGSVCLSVEGCSAPPDVDCLVVVTVYFMPPEPNFYTSAQAPKYRVLATAPHNGPCDEMFMGSLLRKILGKFNIPMSKIIAIVHDMEPAPTNSLLLGIECGYSFKHILDNAVKNGLKVFGEFPDIFYWLTLVANKMSISMPISEFENGRAFLPGIAMGWEVTYKALLFRKNREIMEQFLLAHTERNLIQGGPKQITLLWPDRFTSFLSNAELKTDRFHVISSINVHVFQVAPTDRSAMAVGGHPLTPFESLSTMRNSQRRKTPTDDFLAQDSKLRFHRQAHQIVLDELERRVQFLLETPFGTKMQIATTLDRRYTWRALCIEENYAKFILQTEAFDKAVKTIDAEHQAQIESTSTDLLEQYLLANLAVASRQSVALKRETAFNSIEQVI
ncbi:hypothetical protein L596_000966 [Steinernema carpocapsae]|uniref:BED-type domain-containing protein n=1 Tax=Steinernema carpocapsae TaxID=34508 RepID=A0A4U8UKY0_STECR|nr:hypothetical protein L596_000966 [Steinernema carpocapsae]